MRWHVARLPGALVDTLLSCYVLHKENELRVKSSGESFEKRNYLPGLTSLQFYSPQVKVKLCSGILLGTAFVITSVDNATCAGKEDSSASRKDQEDRACATPISSGLLHDPSTGRFSTSSKTGKAKQKANG